MAGSINKVILVGNLGNNPEIRTTQGGKEMAILSLATSDTWKDKMTGERKERTEWHRIVIFSEGLARVARDYLKKGSKVYIEGELRTRKWTDNSGVDKYTTEIVLQGFSSNLTMLDAKGGGSNNNSNYSNNQSNNQNNQNNQSNDSPDSGSGFPPEIDDEIPF